MPKKRRKSTSDRVCVSRAALNKVISKGAGHHAAIAELRSTVRSVPKKKRAKKTSKRRAKKKTSRRRIRRV